MGDSTDRTQLIVPSTSATIVPGSSPSAGSTPVQRIGPYVLLHPLGRGAMGLVWLAREESLGRLVALKAMLSAGAGEARERFEREARACASLSHPNVVALLGYGEHEGAPYFAMEYVEGRTLADLLRSEQVSAKRGAALVLQAAQGLAHAHERGVVHRDVKPANMLVAEGDRLKVADFGLARLAGQATLAASLGGMGTPNYMAPEQFASARDASPPSDVWSLGATLYEVLTGRPPFHADSIEALFTRVAEEDPLPVRSLSPSVSRDLETVCLKCLEKEPSRRYADAGALAADLARWQRGEPVQARAVGVVGRFVRRVRRNPLPYVAAVLVAAALVGGVGLAQWRARRQRRAEFAALTREAGAETLLAHLPGDATSAIRALVTCEQALRKAQERTGETPPLRYEVNRRLGEEAIMAKDYQLARLAFSVCQSIDAAHAGSDRLEEARIQEEENRESAHRKAHIEGALADISQGLGRAGRPAGAPGLDDYVFEVAGYRDEQTVSLLADALKPLEEKARAGGKDLHWSDPEAQEMTFAFRVMGRLDLPSAVAPLSAMMGVLWEHTLCVECGTALCNTRRAEAEKPLLDAKVRLGAGSGTWRVIRLSLSRIPEAEAAEEPRSAKAFVDRARRWRERHDLAKAIESAARAIDLDAECAEAWYVRGITRTEMRDWGGAIGDLSRAIDLDPTNAAAWTDRGNARMEKGELAEAIQDYTHAIDLDPKEWNAFRGRGVVRGRRGDLDGALQDLTGAIELNPLDPDSWNSRGNVRRLRGEPDEALKDYARAIELDPKHVGAYNGRGSARADKHDWEGALQDFTRLLELDPNNPTGYLNRGVVRQGMGDWEGVVVEWKSALDHLAPNDPRSSQVRGWLATAHVKVAGQRCRASADEAFEHLREAVKVGFNDAEALEGDPALVSLHPDPRWAELLGHIRVGGTK